MEGVVFDIRRFSIHDGPGIRVAVFLKGCPLDCWWCHNPEALRRAPAGSDTGGADALDHFGERRITVTELLDEIAKDQIFIDESGGGVTFSGGEPLVQIDFLEAALDACREREIHTAIDTTGCASAATFARVTGKAGLFLYDLKLMDSEEHRRYTGRPNQPILENFRTLAERRAPVIVRVPIVPGITDTDRNLDAMMEFLLQSGGTREVCLLPYHKAAAHKYRRLRLENRVAGIEPPSAARMEALKRRFEEGGFTVRIGG